MNLKLFTVVFNRPPPAPHQNTNMLYKLYTGYELYFLGAFSSHYKPLKYETEHSFIIFYSCVIQAVWKMTHLIGKRIKMHFILWYCWEFHRIFIILIPLNYNNHSTYLILFWNIRFHFFRIIQIEIYYRNAPCDLLVWIWWIWKDFIVNKFCFEQLRTHYAFVFDE